MLTLSERVKYSNSYHPQCGNRFHTADLVSKTCKICEEVFSTAGTGLNICPSCVVKNDLCRECGKPIQLNNN